MSYSRIKGLGDGSSAAASSAIGGGISAAVSLATSAASLWINSIQLSHVADTATSQIVNGLAPKLQAIVNAYLAGPGTCADQAAAMAGYLSAVNWLYSAAGCGNGAYGSAGNACISDRFGPGGPTDPNAKYPWAAYYYLPIANDPRAAACAAQVAADNPDAALQAAIANVSNPGSTQQTTAGLFDTTSAGTSSAEASTGLPSWALWAAAGLALILIVK